MAIEKSAPATTPQFLPRLAPHPARPMGFGDVLAATLDKSPVLPPLPARPDRPMPLRHNAAGVLGAVSREIARPVAGEVYGTISQPDAPNFPAGQASAPAVGSQDPAQVARKTHDHGHAQASRQASTPGHAKTSATATASSQFTPDEEAALRIWAQAVNPLPHPRVQHAKAPSLDDKPSVVAASVSGAPDSLTETAAALIGKRYVAGGDSPRQGFDCSGLTSYVYSKNGLELPRNSREQFQQGTPVARQDLRKGDLVFFGKKGVHHVGIYAGDGNFIHAASGKVHVSSLDGPVWGKLYAGARRMM